MEGAKTKTEEDRREEVTEGGKARQRRTGEKEGRPGKVTLEMERVKGRGAPATTEEVLSVYTRTRNGGWGEGGQAATGKGWEDRVRLGGVGMGLERWLF